MFYLTESPIGKTHNLVRKTIIYCTMALVSYKTSPTTPYWQKKKMLYLDFSFLCVLLKRQIFILIKSLQLFDQYYFFTKNITQLKNS